LTNGAAYQISFYTKFRFYNPDLTLQEAPPSVQEKMLMYAVFVRAQHREIVAKLAQTTDPDEKKMLNSKLLRMYEVPQLAH